MSVLRALMIQWVFCLLVCHWPPSPATVLSDHCAEAHDVTDAHMCSQVLIAFSPIIIILKTAFVFTQVIFVKYYNLFKDVNNLHVTNAKKKERGKYFYTAFIVK